MKTMRHAKRRLVMLVAALAILTGVVRVGPSAAGDMQLVLLCSTSTHTRVNAPAYALAA